MTANRTDGRPATDHSQPTQYEHRNPALHVDDDVVDGDDIRLRQRQKQQQQRRQTSERHPFYVPAIVEHPAAISGARSAADSCHPMGNLLTQSPPESKSLPQIRYARPGRDPGVRVNGTFSPTGIETGRTDFFLLRGSSQLLFLRYIKPYGTIVWTPEQPIELAGWVQQNVERSSRWFSAEHFRIRWSHLC